MGGNLPRVEEIKIYSLQMDESHAYYLKGVLQNAMTNSETITERKYREQLFNALPKYTDSLR